MRIALMQVPCACVFHGYFRLQALLRLDGIDASDPDVVSRIFPRLIVGQLWVDRRAACRWAAEHQAVELTLEALVDRALFPQQATLEIACDGRMASLPVGTLIAAAAADHANPLNRVFADLVAAAARDTADGRPRMLDIGGRARSGVERRQQFPQCDVTTFDIVADPSVDVVGDAHELSHHFAPNWFDLAFCVSVFEHLLMPWKAALEINAVLRQGGVALIHTHQTIGMHDLPWDFWRYSDTAWHGLFNAATGFEVLHTSLQGFMHIVPRAWNDRYRQAEQSGGFEGSTVIVRKIGPTALRWDVPLSSVLVTHYPLAADGNPEPARRAAGPGPG